jgi:hypothetical protein
MSLPFIALRLLDGFLPSPILLLSPLNVRMG